MDKIKAWLDSKSKDFDKGIKILEDNNYKPGVIRVLKKHGVNGPEAKERLMYHMRECFLMNEGYQRSSADEDEVLNVFNGEESKKDNEPESILKAYTSNAELPTEVKDVVKHYANLYKERSILERLLGEQGENNDEETIAKRKEISDRIEQCQDEMEKLYPKWIEYTQTGSVSPDAEEPEPKKEEQEKKLSENELSGMSKDELQKIRKSLATKISRARNMLEYQTESKGDEPNPMTDKIKIVKYNAKIERLTKEMEKVMIAIAQFG